MAESGPYISGFDLDRLTMVPEDAVQERSAG